MYDIITCFAIRRQRFAREGRFATRKKTTRGISVKLKNNVIWLIVHFFLLFHCQGNKGKLFDYWKHSNKNTAYCGLLFIDCRCFRQREVVETFQKRLKLIGNFQPITNAVATASFLVVFINALKNEKTVFI